MNLEGITLYALTEYLKQEITGSRIYKIGMPSGRSLYFSLKREYDTLHLIIDVNAAAPQSVLQTKRQTIHRNCRLSVCCCGNIWKKGS